MPEIRWCLDCRTEARGDYYTDARGGHQEAGRGVGLPHGHQLAVKRRYLTPARSPSRQQRLDHIGDFRSALQCGTHLGLEDTSCSSGCPEAKCLERAAHLVCKVDRDTDEL